MRVHCSRQMESRALNLIYIGLGTVTAGCRNSGQVETGTIWSAEHSAADGKAGVNLPTSSTNINCWQLSVYTRQMSTDSSVHQRSSLMLPEISSSSNTGCGQGWAAHFPVSYHCTPSSSASNSGCE